MGAPVTVTGQVIKNPSVSINGVDLSGYFSEIVVKKSVADVSATGFRSGGSEQHLQGLRSDSFTGTAKNDFSASGIYFVLNALFEEGVEFNVSVTPTQSAVSVTNPKFECDSCVMVGDYQPFGGSAGALSTTPITIMTNAPIIESYT